MKLSSLRGHGPFILVGVISNFFTKFLDYEQSLCFLIVRRERSEKTGRAKVGRTKAVVWAKGEEKGTTDKATAFDLSRPSDFMVFISNLINRNLSSISQSHFCVVGATHKSNAEALGAFHSTKNPGLNF